MCNPLSNDILCIRDEYLNWLQTGNQTKKIVCQIEKINAVIIFNRALYLYLEPNNPIPSIIENSFNITSTNNEKIKEIFLQNVTRSSKDCYIFPEHNYHRFTLRFFNNEKNIMELLSKEEKFYRKYKLPRQGALYECNLA